MKHPVFGQRIRLIHASEKNPHREGIFVEMKRIPRGRINPGIHYRMTDGKGDFWEAPPSACEILSTNPTA